MKGWRFALPLAAALAGCAAPPPPPPPPVSDARACLMRLAATGAVHQPLADMLDGGGCGVTGAVRMSGGAIPWARPGVVTCNFALALQDFEAAVVQPLARGVLGQPVRKIHHYGTYACRGRNGRAGARLSEHAFGRAIDIAAFELADGSMVEVGRHWRGAGRRSEFLHRVARGACDRFSVVLTPNHDGAHRDHLHVDLGPWRLCGL